MKHSTKTILAAIDNSEASRSVFKETLVLASTLRARVVIVAVTPNYEGNMNRFCIEDAQKKFDEPFQKILEEAFDYANSLGLSLKTVHRKGKPSDEILEVALEESVSLIVLGGKRKLQFERMLLGRILAEIVTNSRCDVLVIPEGSEIRFSNILVDVAESEQGILGEIRAFDIAESYGSQVHGLYSVDIPAERSLRYGVAREAEEKATAALEAFSSRAELRGISVINSMDYNIPEHCLANYAKARHMDLIVLGVRTEQAFIEIFGGSTIERLVSISSCPILAVKNGERQGRTSVAAFF